MHNIPLRFTKDHEGVHTPSRGSEYAAGYDIHAYIEDGVKYINPGYTGKIHTGLHLEIPKNYYGALYARSGLATKNGLRPANCVGVIDADYRGEIIVPLYNDSKEMQEIHNGDRICQLAILPYMPVDFIEVESLSETERGAGGFGSTGVAGSTSTCAEYEQMSLFGVDFVGETKEDA